MPLQSSDTPQLGSFPLDNGPVLELASPGGNVPEHPLRIRAQRAYPAPPEELFESWTRRTVWESWMRLRARSRATLAPYRGGAYRLELAEGPAIHVITGVVTELRSPECLSLDWRHHDTTDLASTIDVAFQALDDGTLLTLVHGSISNRREAAWLMRLWGIALDRLGQHVRETHPLVKRVCPLADRLPRLIESAPRRRAAGRAAERGASSAA